MTENECSVVRLITFVGTFVLLVVFFVVVVVVFTVVGLNVVGLAHPKPTQVVVKDTSPSPCRLSILFAGGCAWSVEMQSFVSDWITNRESHCGYMRKEQG